ncbi:hypothetical protein LEP1GSC021_3430 [Leptospira noguchii str. 1993005606]|uniref:Uncharacterized protein n=4 Tax=Leptospira noguchii TaxID=28182 RepID=M6YXX9_9LEPT|nr:hypothetical protein LEP1GSC035_0112 [Leptospira noguchii str. 2007001578]EMO54487.1 hypothetical protein LEP1GSC172_2740 [Leptospira noguchii]EMO91193.1 hypothetical protein LEP1GSC024_1044 [Leptospira noguchii str. 2001034031]EPE84686.1 hypothetical protein LEP1GSC021_3430 [Leptospira noguchii str. 1993005606]EQA73327.1 hypothetical protein LEP1GSC059_0423 [Leptospira noguchii serovar Panama str. CZ214]
MSHFCYTDFLNRLFIAKLKWEFPHFINKKSNPVGVPTKFEYDSK